MAKLGLAFLSTMVALTSAELVVRWSVPTSAIMRCEQEVKELQRSRLDNFTKVVENDSDLFWRLAPNQKLSDTDWPFRGVVSNGQGLREDHDIPPKKDSGELRILFLGDSCTFGYGLLHTEGFANQVEAKLRSQFPGARLECINAGVPGYSLFQAQRFLETKGFDYQPDLIVLNFGWNDGSTWDDMSDLDHYHALRSIQPPPILGWSRICQLAWAATHPQQRIHGPARPRLLPDEFKSLLAQLHEAARHHNAELLLLVWPQRFNIDPTLSATAGTPYQRELLNYGRDVLRLGPDGSEALVDFVPVVRDMAKKVTADAIFLDQGHATRLANEQFAQAIVEKITPWMYWRMEHERDALGR